MGLAPRRTARAAFLAAVPVILGSLVLGSTALADPGQAQPKEGQVAATGALKFDPATVNVAVGGKVTWTYVGGTYHTVTGGDLSPDTSSPIQGGVLDQTHKTFVVTFPKAGTYPYFCQPHASVGMKGEIVVGTPTTPSPTVSVVPTDVPVPPASGSASPVVGDVPPGAGAPTAEGTALYPGIDGNDTLAAIDAERAGYHGAVSGFRFFTLVALAFLVILSAAILFSTRPRRSGR
jgi:plastocyanin